MADQVKNKNVAAILAAFGGILGLHKFYLGRSSSGIMYAFITLVTMGIVRIPISAILGFIDAITILGMSQEKFDRKYNRGRNSSRNVHQRRRKEEGRTTRTISTPATRRKVKKNPYKTSAAKKLEEYDLKEAILDYENALKIAPDDPDIHYGMASTYSLEENAEKAFYHLGEAVRYGLKDQEKILKDDNLAFLRIQDQFETLRLKGFQQTKGKTLKPSGNDLLEDDVLLSQLNKLSEMRKKGLLSQAEFAQERKKLLRR